MFALRKLYISSKSVELPIPRTLAHILLRINRSNRILIMCRGYNEDYDNLTELVWEDDRMLDFQDRDSYPEFQLWIRR